MTSATKCEGCEHNIRVHCMTCQTLYRLATWEFEVRKILKRTRPHTLKLWCEKCGDYKNHIVTELPEGRP